MSVHEDIRLLQGELGGDAARTGVDDITDPTDLNAKVIPVALAKGKNVGGAVVSRLAEPVYVVAFRYPEKINDETVTMQFLVSGFRPGPQNTRTEQIENAFGDSHDHVLYRQLTREEVQACGQLALEAHNGVYAAPITRGSAVYMRMTKNEKVD
jgi:hypothetical protein